MLLLHHGRLVALLTISLFGYVPPEGGFKTVTFTPVNKKPTTLSVQVQHHLNSSYRQCRCENGKIVTIIFAPLLFGCEAYLEYKI